MGGLQINANRRFIDLTDPVRRETLTITTDEPASATPTPPPTDLPVEAAVSVSTTEFRSPRGYWTCIRDEADHLCAQFDYDVADRFPDGPYTVEIDGPLKAYARIPTGVDVRTAPDSVVFSLDEAAEVLVGGRLRRKFPRETITATTDGEDLLEAVSHLSATLQTTSPERSFPSLRAHPPAIELGDAFHAPAHLDRPDSGLELVVPPEAPYAFAAAPLAYYLAAAVVPGGAPRLQRTDGTVLYEFDDEEFDRDVFTVLRHVFTLDCAVRTAGLYPLEFDLARAVERRLDDDVPDFEALYGLDLATRTQRYLEVPVDRLRDRHVRWPLGAVVEPRAEHATALPYLVNELAYVSVSSPRVVSGPSARAEAGGAFLDTELSSARSAGEVFAGDASFARVPELPTTHTTYVGEHIPLAGGKYLAAGARHRRRREARDGPISVTVVCNEREMDDEATVIRDLYGRETSADVRVDSADELSVAELAAVIGEDVDVLHFIGHATPEGLECRDGVLDVADVADVRVNSFVLNACQSYRQGVRLVRRGSIAGAVALSDVENEDAVAVGVALARFLSAGFPFRTAVALARRASVVGGQYLVVGDGSLTLSRPESFVPLLIDIERREGDAWRLSLDLFTTAATGLGGWFTPNVGDGDVHYVNSGSTPTIELGGEELRSFLDTEPAPVRVDSELRWTDEFDLGDLGPGDDADPAE